MLGGGEGGQPCVYPAEQGPVPSRVVGPGSPLWKEIRLRAPAHPSPGLGRSRPSFRSAHLKELQSREVSARRASPATWSCERCPAEPGVGLGRLGAGWGWG